MNREDAEKNIAEEVLKIKSILEEYLENIPDDELNQNQKIAKEKAYLSIAIFRDSFSFNSSLQLEEFKIDYHEGVKNGSKSN